MASGAGVSEADFVSGPLKDFGKEVKLNRVTKTVSNISGERTLTYGDDEYIEVVQLRRNVLHDYSQEGMVEKGDAYIMSKVSDELKRGDKITTAGEIYRIESVIHRNPDGKTPMFDFCTLHLISSG